MKNFVIDFIKNNLKEKRLLIIICICVFIIVFFIIKVYDNHLLEKEENSFVLNVDNEIDSNTKEESKNNIEEDGDSLSEKIESESKIENKTENVDKETIEDNKKSNNICVYITGEVNNAGVYYLENGSRVIDAINLAGGTTSNANLSKINLAYVLEDGMKINIPNDNDLKNNPNFEYITKASGDERTDTVNNTEDKSALSESSNKTETININTASQTELETLPGIGPSLALRIIKYREENGNFKSIEDIKNVSGIGDSRFENIKGYIVVK